MINCLKLGHFIDLNTNHSKARTRTPPGRICSTHSVRKNISQLAIVCLLGGRDRRLASHRELVLTVL